MLVPGRLSQALASTEWKGIQERFRDRRIVAPGGIAFAGSQFVFAGYSGEPFSKNIRITVRCIRLVKSRPGRLPRR